MKSTAYQALVRPQLEYAAETWNPYNITTADHLARIQRAAARYVHHDNRQTTSVWLTFWAGIAVVSSPHQSPRCGASRFRSAQSITIPLSVLSASISGWDRLHTRRLVSQLTMFHKIHYHLVNIHIPQLISPVTFICKHDYQLKYTIPVATIDSYKFSFYPRSIILWNQLPSTAVFAASPVVFQAITLPAVIEMKLPIGSKML